ncbi:MAG: acyl carrier protein [Candidatus Promineifilaceae bacterium]
MDDINQTIKSYILEEFLNGEEAQTLTGSTPLISGRFLDSLATLRLVEFLRQRYDVEILPEEMTEEYLDTIDDIAQLVRSKTQG